MNNLKGYCQKTCGINFIILKKTVNIEESDTSDLPFLILGLFYVLMSAKIRNACETVKNKRGCLFRVLLQTTSFVLFPRYILR